MSVHPYKVWDIPPTKEQLKEYMDEDGRLSGVLVPVKMNELLDWNLEDFLTEIAERAGVPLLGDMSYSVEGHNENTLHINVIGDAQYLLEEEDE